MAIDFDPADLRRIVSALNEAEENAATVLGPAKSALRSARWNDPQRAKFEEMIRAADANVNRLRQDSAEMKRFLNKLIALGEQYHGMS